METCVSQTIPKLYVREAGGGGRERERENTYIVPFALGEKKIWQNNSFSIRKDLSTNCQNYINEKGSLAFLHRTNIFLLIPMKTPDTTQPANLCLLLPIM